MDNQQKYKVISLLQNDATPKDIADDLNVSYGTVLKLRREYDDAKRNGTVNQLVDMDDVILSEVASKLSELPGGEEVLGEFTEKLKGLEHLSEEFQTTAHQINTRARSLLLSIEHVSELEIITDILCKLQTSFINKNMTQVSVQNNYTDNNTPKYNQYLGDVPSD